MALKAALDSCSLPVICTLTVQEDGRALFGGTAAEAVETLQERGASAVGVNCSVGPDQLKEVVRSMKEKAKVPLVAKPNAGIPWTDGNGQAVYRMMPEEFAETYERTDPSRRRSGGRLLRDNSGIYPKAGRSCRMRLTAAKRKMPY